VQHPLHRDLDADFQESLQFQRLTCDCVLQGLAIEELHSDEGPAFVFANFINGTNVRMVSEPKRHALPVENVPMPADYRAALRQKLQGGEAAQCGVLGLVDDPHPPAQLIATGIIGGLLELFSAKFFIERVADDLAEKLVERVVQTLCVFKAYHSTSFWRGLRGAKILAHHADILGPGLAKPSPNYCSQILWPS